MNGISGLINVQFSNKIGQASKIQANIETSPKLKDKAN